MILLLLALVEVRPSSASEDESAWRDVGGWLRAVNRVERLSDNAADLGFDVAGGELEWSRQRRLIAGRAIRVGMEFRVGLNLRTLQLELSDGTHHSVHLSRVGPRLQIRIAPMDGSTMFRAIGVVDFHPSAYGGDPLHQALHTIRASASSGAEAPSALYRKYAHSSLERSAFDRLVRLLLSSNFPVVTTGGGEGAGVVTSGAEQASIRFLEVGKGEARAVQISEVSEVKETTAGMHRHRPPSDEEFVEILAVLGGLKRALAGASEAIPLNQLVDVRRGLVGEMTRDERQERLVEWRTKIDSEVFPTRQRDMRDVDLHWMRVLVSGSGDGGRAQPHVWLQRVDGRWKVFDVVDIGPRVDTGLVNPDEVEVVVR